MANLPKKLKIGGHIVEVKLQKLHETNGEFDSETNIITISSEITDSQKESTLIHEIFHVMNTSVDEGYGHALIDSFAEQIYQVLKDNATIQWKNAQHVKRKPK